MTRRRHERSETGLWIGLALGVPLMAWGMRGIVLDSGQTHPAELARWIVGSAAVHDALVLPVVSTVAVVARRLAPPSSWPVVRWALATTAILAIVAWPFVRGYGRRPDNPSLLPRNYAGGTMAVLAGVWLVALALAVWAHRRSGRAAP